MATYEELIAEPEVKARMDAMVSKYPGKRLRPIDTAAGVVICVNPSRPQYNMYLSMLWDDDKTANAKAHEVLMRACVVDPEPAVFGQWLDEYPGIPADRDVVQELRKLAGAAKDAAAKKIAAARKRFRSDESYAAQCWIALFAGEDSFEAEAAAMQYNKSVAFQIAFVRAHEKKR